MSWNKISTPALANIIPVTPPTVNKKIKPKLKIKGVLNRNEPPHIVANQLKVLIPVGIAMTMVADVK